MASLHVPFVSSIAEAEINTGAHKILNEPWLTEPAPCMAEFQIAHLNDALFLKFKVREPFLRAMKRVHNGDIHEDNCVEFFFAFPGDDHYYNFEFNCLGSVKAGYGSNRQHRKFFDKTTIDKIIDKLSLSIDNLPDDRRIAWQLSVLLDMDAFPFHHYTSLAGLQCTGNFTKCGDGLPLPHFLTWSNILSERPDFHRMECFGKIDFA